MLWDMAHRTRKDSEATSAQVEAPTSWAAIEKLRLDIPDDHLVLYVRKVESAA